MYVGIGPSQMGLKHFGSPRGTGTGACIPSLPPSYPMGMIFPRLIPHRKKIDTIPVPLIGEFPAGNRGTGPR